MVLYKYITLKIIFIYVDLVHFSLEDDQDLDNKKVSIDLLPTSLDNASMTSSISSSSSEPLLPQVANQRVIKSCLWSTVIFSINFISSILVINLAKWYNYFLIDFLELKIIISFLFSRIYVKHHFPNLTLTIFNFFITFLLLLICKQAKLFTHVKLPILSMIPISVCFGGFIALSNLSLQYNTVGTYQLIKLQVTPST